MEKKDKRILVLSGFIFLILILIIWYAYRQGKKQTTIAPLPTDNVSTGQQSTGVGDAVISATATSLYNEMSGINWFGYHDAQPYKDAMILSDTDFVKLYNFFNTKYQPESNETLTQWVSSQDAIPYSPFDYIQEQMLARLGKLNLK